MFFLLSLFRPKPEFNTSTLVKVNHKLTGNRDSDYMIIRDIRFLCPNGFKEKIWVYDGVIIKITNERKIVFFTNISCVPESEISKVC